MIKKHAKTFLLIDFKSIFLLGTIYTDNTLNVHILLQKTYADLISFVASAAP